LIERSTDKVVLIVDDDVPVRQMLARALAFERFVVVEAGNGQEALSLLRTGGRRPDAIVLDLRMPVMDGWAFRLVQQADPTIAAIPVVVLSGADSHRFPELGAVAALEKPVAIAQLTNCLHEVFADKDTAP
jgi:CheY-like chemotaxis protein